jgi:glycosyltransferase involved in cell wall biosynthesis
MNIQDFSLVCPVKDEAKLLSTTLPSFYKIKPSEIVLCFDDPVSCEETYNLCRKISQQYRDVPTIFVNVEPNPEYMLNQAWVRRVGFRKAKHDRILTVDVDLVVNPQVLKAVALIGANNVGLVSCSKRYPHKGIQRFWLMVTEKIINFVYPIQFTGLYALWRPYWLDTEDDGVKNLTNTKNGLSTEVQTGEDTYLRNCMNRKHRVLHLNSVSAKCLHFNSADLPNVQWQDGRYFASQGYGLFRMMLKVLLYFRIYSLLGWLYQKRQKN